MPSSATAPWSGNVAWRRKAGVAARVLHDEFESGMTLDVAPGESILDAMIEADVFVSCECKRSECGTCYAGVVLSLIHI